MVFWIFLNEISTLSVVGQQNSFAAFCHKISLLSHSWSSIIWMELQCYFSSFDRGLGIFLLFLALSPPVSFKINSRNLISDKREGRHCKEYLDLFVKVFCAIQSAFIPCWGTWCLSSHVALCDLQGHEDKKSKAFKIMQCHISERFL